jgi:aspartate 1-decarboxylase
MKRILCKSKIHRATITGADLNYEGSLSIDEDLLEAADIIPYEMVSVANVANGERFETYAIKGKRGSGEICLNGAAARLGMTGDEIIIMTYANFDENELKGFQPKIVLVDKDNKIIHK